jgi:hypothetical protein
VPSGAAGVKCLRGGGVPTEAGAGCSQPREGLRECGLPSGAAGVECPPRGRSAYKGGTERPRAGAECPRVRSAQRYRGDGVLTTGGGVLTKKGRTAYEGGVPRGAAGWGVTPVQG